jgi:hypothetical protein
MSLREFDRQMWDDIAPLRGQPTEAKGGDVQG